jgi:hypothetical protein
MLAYSSSGSDLKTYVWPFLNPSDTYQVRETGGQAPAAVDQAALDAKVVTARRRRRHVGILLTNVANPIVLTERCQAYFDTYIGVGAWQQNVSLMHK